MIKNGFLFVELSIGLTLLTILIFIITHYIIEVKNVQQHTLLRIEALSYARSAVEKSIAHSHQALLPVTLSINDAEQFTVIVKKQPSDLIVHKQKKNAYELHSAVVSWQFCNKKYSLSLPLCALKNKNDSNGSDNDA
jgi:hypothetical protein